MKKKQFIKFIIIFLIIISALLAGVLFSSQNSTEHKEAIQEIMQDAVLHETGKVNFLGMNVNPSLISGIIITGIFLIFGIIVRFVLVPKFKKIPGKFQMFLELMVGLFDNMASSNSPHMNGLLGGYIFTAAAYIFVSTIFELIGIQVVTTKGVSISLPAPLSDINGAIMLGCVSYLFIMSGGLIANGLKGVGLTLKDFSLPISMSFRLFGALLSGALVTELVYYYTLTSFVLPVFVGVLFTLLHAIIQSYVLTTLTSVFYGEVTEKKPKKPKNKAAKAA